MAETLLAERVWRMGGAFCGHDPKDWMRGDLGCVKQLTRINEPTKQVMLTATRWVGSSPLSPRIQP